MKKKGRPHPRFLEQARPLAGRRRSWQACRTGRVFEQCDVSRSCNWQGRVATVGWKLTRGKKKKWLVPHLSPQHRVPVQQHRLLVQQNRRKFVAPCPSQTAVWNQCTDQIYGSPVVLPANSAATPIREPRATEFALAASSRPQFVLPCHLML